MCCVCVYVYMCVVRMMYIYVNECVLYVCVSILVYECLVCLCVRPSLSPHTWLVAPELAPRDRWGWPEGGASPGGLQGGR